MTNQSSLPSKLTVQDINERMEKPNLIFHGYCTDYRYGNFNQWEYSEAMFSDAWDKNDNPLNNRLVGNSWGHASDSFWKVRVVDGCAYKQPEDYARTHVWVEPIEKSNGAVPVELHHSDVFPSVLKDDILTFQVSLLPKKVTYIKTEDPEYLPYCSPDPIIVLNEEEPFKADNHRVVHLLGGIRHVDRIKASQDESEKVLVWILTRFGPLCLVHSIDLVNKNERKLIKIGNSVVVSGHLMADCAVGDYQQGARFDHSTLMTLFKNTLATGRLFRLFKAMKPLCELKVNGVNHAFDEESEDKRNEILRLLNEWFSHGSLSLGAVGRLKQNPHQGDFDVCFIHRTPNNKVDAVIRLTVNDNRITCFHVDSKPDIMKRIQLESVNPTKATVN